MSFLPKGNPILKVIDIASICIPAFEVGGDYYDFIHLGKNKL
jgi:serine phosphatase RsbU (regulator of sigma subunit)